MSMHSFYLPKYELNFLSPTVDSNTYWVLDFYGQWNLSYGEFKVANSVQLVAVF